MKPQRILVFSATFGAGHIKAAEALIQAIKDREPTAEIIHQDFMVLINKALNYVIRTSYIKLIKHTPKIWGSFYNRTQKLGYDSLFQRFLNTLGRRQFVKYVNSLQPDVIVCTYPTVAGVLAQLRMKGELNMPLITVVTDYAVHSQWIHPGVDLYLVGNAQVYSGLVERGVDPSRIQVTGIPVSPLFERHLARDAVLWRLGLAKDRLTFLIMGGAYGVLGKARWLCRLMANAPFPVQSIVVCGKDKKLYRSLDPIIEKARNPIVRFRFVNNIDELMTAADVIITKAGGLTVSEALAKRLPMIIFKPIPGQEENNAIYVEEIGAGRIARTEEQLLYILHQLIATPEEIEKMSKAAARACAGHTAERAVDAILSLTNPSLPGFPQRDRQAEFNVCCG